MSSSTATKPATPAPSKRKPLARGFRVERAAAHVELADALDRPVDARFELHQQLLDLAARTVAAHDGGEVERAFALWVEVGDLLLEGRDRG